MMDSHAMANMWRSEVNFIEFSFHLYMGSGNQTQGVRLTQ